MALGKSQLFAETMCLMSIEVGEGFGVVADHGGQVPQEPAILATLPGIGRYMVSKSTAGISPSGSRLWTSQRAVVCSLRGGAYSRVTTAFAREQSAAFSGLPSIAAKTIDNNEL